MFEAASNKFAKSVGEDVLLPVPTLDQNRQCTPFQVVIKKNRRFRWQSAKYSPTPFNLSQLLVDGETDSLENNLKPATKSALVYNKIHKLSLKGKIGAKIKVLLDMELDGSDTVDVEAKFGNVNKTMLDQTKLMDLLKSRHINLDHSFIKQVCEHPKNVLCVVVASYELDSSGTIIAKKDISGEEKFGEEKVVKNLAEATEDISIDDDNENAMIVPATTVVAYKVCELLIKSDKTLELIIERELSGGFKSVDEVDSVLSQGACCISYSSNNLSAIDQPLEDMFNAFLSMKFTDKSQLVQAVLQMCTFPKDIDTALVILKQALALVREEEATGIGLNKTTVLSVLKSKFLCADQDWASILQLSGFNFIADGSVEYPKMSCPYLEPMVNLYKALIELEDFQLITLSNVTSEYAKPLLCLLTETIKGRTVEKTDGELSTLFSTGDNFAVKFITKLGFEVEDGKKLQYTKGNNDHQLQGAVRVVYALFWLKDYDKDIKWKCSV